MGNPAEIRINVLGRLPLPWDKKTRFFPIEQGPMSRLIERRALLEYLKGNKGYQAQQPVRTQEYYNQLAKDLKTGIYSYNPKTGKHIFANLDGTATYRFVRNKAGIPIQQDYKFISSQLSRSEKLLKFFTNLLKRVRI